MKHSKLWTALALPLMLAACAKSDKAGVSAPDCLNISGEWAFESNQGNPILFTQEGCNSLTVNDSGKLHHYSITENELEGKMVRAIFAPTTITLVSVQGTIVETITITKSSEDSLETSVQVTVDGNSNDVPFVQRHVRVKPAPTEAAPVEPTQENPAPVEPTPVEPTPANPAQVEPTQVEPTPTNPTQVEPAQMEPVQVEPAQVEPAQVEPAQVEPAQVEPAQVEPAQVEPAPTKRDPYAILNQIRQNLGDKLSKLKWN